MRLPQLAILLLLLASPVYAKKADDLRAYADLLRAQTDYQRMLIQARLADAEIQLKQAQAELAHAKAEQIRLQTEILRHEYARLVAEENIVSQRILDIELKANLVRPLRLGRIDQGVLIGLDYFLRVIVPVGVVKDVMWKKVDPLPVENFVAGETGEPVKPFPGGNLGRLYSFLKSSGCSLAEWSQGHLVMIEMLEAFTKAADDRIEQYHKYMEEIRLGTAKLWQLPKEIHEPLPSEPAGPHGPKPPAAVRRVSAQDDPFGPTFAATYEEIVATFSGLVEKSAGALTKTSLLRTPGDRELGLYTLGNARAGKRTLLLCNHHGDEQWVAQLCVDFTKYLVAVRDTDPLVKEVLQKSAIDILPLGNPDGFATRHRFNARNVDINRNFPFMWGYKEPGTVNFNPGPSAMSEPETKALHDYQIAHAGEWVVILNYHLSLPDSGEENYILLPWAYTKKKLLTAAEMARYRAFLPDESEAPSFKVDTVPNVFYPCSGTHTDWSWHELGAPALTMELGHGYELPSRVEYLEKHLKGENLPVFRRFLEGVRSTLRAGH